MPQRSKEEPPGTSISKSSQKTLRNDSQFGRIGVPTAKAPLQVRREDAHWIASPEPIKEFVRWFPIAHAHSEKRFMDSAIDLTHSMHDIERAIKKYLKASRIRIVSPYSAFVDEKVLYICISQNVEEVQIVIEIRYSAA